MLLLSILPKQIANLLKASSRRIAHQHEAASILFTDIVDFSGLARRMRPDELVDFLDDVFLEFDRLVEEDGLEKIKTIGDCYMVAAGVPRPREDHAQALARLALAMRRCSANRTFFGRRIDLRIGMNSGPVVAGVIGRKKFIYDLWSDAVNVASRMEASGYSGSIQVTRATRDLLGPGFVCEPAGVLNLKGIGETEVFQLVGESRAADRAESAPEPLRLGTAPLAPPVQARGRESGNAQRGKGSLP
jgi:guanylate cyclase